MLYNISNFYNIKDYLYLLNAGLITDLIVIMRIIFGQINIKSLNIWYRKFGLLAVIADVLSIVIGIIIARYIYTFFFKEYSLLLFIIITVGVQVIHDISFAYLFNLIPRNKSEILDIFKDYGKEVGFTIILADSLMMISTVLIGTYLSYFSININIIILIISLYILPYFLYSIKSK